MDKFQYDYQCCGWEGPEDYAISFPQSCCGRSKLSSKTCGRPYPNGCRREYLDKRNIIEVWRIICDAVRLIIIVSVFFLLAIFYLYQVKKRKKQRVNERKLLMLLEEQQHQRSSQVIDQGSGEWSSVKSCDIERSTWIIEPKQNFNNMETVPENSKQHILEEDVPAERTGINESIPHSSENVSSDEDEVLVGTPSTYFK